eukprot:m.342931 g.342931  ORF g.342931 m.342931 type:complete len:496 (+) comp22037_c0_seq1:78-1565(+)
MRIAMSLQLLLLLCCITKTHSQGLPWIHSSNTRGDARFIDENGNTRIFHGVNRVPKFDPWYFEDMLDSETEFQEMKALGINVVRLGFMWSGYNPAPGVFNATYMNVMKTIIGKLNSHNIYALLDMHQDVLSSKFCTYDGVPLWVINKSLPKHAFPWPLKGNCSRFWEDNIFAQAAATAYQDIYDNNHNMLDDLKSFWSHAAAELKDIPGIIGYEIMNEPFAGNFYTDPAIMVPGVAGKKNLQRMNDAVASAIRQSDSRHLIFFEPVTWGMIFDGKIVGSGFEHVPGGDSYMNLSTFSYHYYCASFVPDWQGKPFWRRAVCDDTIGPLVFEAVKGDLKKFGGSAMMTEGLSCDGPNISSYDECIDVMDDLDRNLFSFTDYGVSQGASWQPSTTQKYVWARTYARTVDGIPLNMSFNVRSSLKEFDFCFTPKISTGKSFTEIFASKLVYANGVDVAKANTINVITAEDTDDYYIFHVTALSNEDACLQIKSKNSLLN